MEQDVGEFAHGLGGFGAKCESGADAGQAFGKIDVGHETSSGQFKAFRAFQIDRCIGREPPQGLNPLPDSFYSARLKPCPCYKTGF